MSDYAVKWLENMFSVISDKLEKALVLVAGVAAGLIALFSMIAVVNRYIFVKNREL